MTKINITEFFNYDSKALYEFLLLQNETEFQIIIPRENVSGNAENILIMIDYLNAAWAGQLLSSGAVHFAYFVPSISNKASFQFDVSVTDIEKFTDQLHEVIKGFNHQFDEKSFIDFQERSAQFLNEAFNEDYNCSTWGLLYIANQLLQL